MREGHGSRMDVNIRERAQTTEKKTEAAGQAAEHSTDHTGRAETHSNRRNRRTLNKHETQ